MSLVQLTPAALAKLRKFVTLSDTLRQEAALIGAKRLERIDERDKARLSLTALERELGSGRASVVIRHKHDHELGDNYAASRTREIEAERQRLSLIEDEIDDLNTREAQYATQRSWLGGLCQRLLEASGQIQMREQLRGNR